MRAMMVWLRPLALLLALAALLMLAFSGPGVRFGLWSYDTGIAVLRYTAYLAIVAALVSAIALAIARVRARGVLLPMAALLVSLAVLYVPLQFLQRARAVPPINDITTDTENPPRYMTGERAYPGAEFARQQRAAYPDIAPLLLAVAPREAFARAVAAAGTIMCLSTLATSTAEDVAGLDSSGKPAVVGVPAMSMLSFTANGTPCSCPSGAASSAARAASSLASELMNAGLSSSRAALLAVTTSGSWMGEAVIAAPGVRRDVPIRARG